MKAICVVHIKNRFDFVCNACSHYYAHVFNPNSCNVCNVPILCYGAECVTEDRLEFHVEANKPGRGEKSEQRLSD